MRCRAKAEYGNSFSFETFHGIDVRPDDEPIIEKHLCTPAIITGSAPAASRRTCERTGHLTELHFTGDQRLYAARV